MNDNSRFWCFFWLILSCFWTAWNSYQFAITKIVEPLLISIYALPEYIDNICKHLKDANYFIEQINDFIVKAATKGEEYLTIPIEDELLKDEILCEVKNYYETNGFRVYIREPLTGCYCLKIYW